MNVSTMSKKEVTALVFTFCALFVVAIIIGALGPPVADSFTLRASDQGIDMRSNVTQFVWEIKNLDRLNQLILLRMTGVPKDVASGYAADILAALSLWGSTNGLQYTAFADRRAFTRSMSCAKGKALCDPEVIMYDPFIRYKYYRVGVTFLNAASFDWLVDVEFSFIFLTYQFTLFELWFRGIFLALSVFASIAYLLRLRKFHFADWSYEQKWIGLLLLMLMFFNNPLVSLRVLINSWLFVVLDILFLVNFLAMLLLFFLCEFDGLRKPALSRDFKGFYLPKVALVGLMWIILLAVLAWLQFHDLADPRYSTVNDIPGFVFIRVVQMILIVTYVFWLLFLSIRAYSERQNMPHVSQRLQVVGILTYLVLGIVVIALLVSALSTQESSAAQFLAFHALFNLYIYVLAISFAPSSDARQHSASAGVGALSRIDDPEGSDDARPKPGAAGAGAGASRGVMMDDAERSIDSDEDFAAERSRRRQQAAAGGADDDIKPMSVVQREAAARAATANSAAAAPVHSTVIVGASSGAAPAAAAAPPATDSGHADASDKHNPFAEPPGEPQATHKTPFPVML